MKSSIDLLNQAMKTNSGYQLVKILGLSGTGAVSNWKKRGHVSPYYAAKLAELVGEDPKEAIAVAGAEAEPDQQKRTYLLKKLSAALATLAVVSVNLFLTPEKAEAAPLLAHNSIEANQHFILCQISKMLAAVSTRLKRLFFCPALQPATR